MDLATADEGNSRVTLLAGNGDGTFQLPQALKVAARPVGLAAGDLNGDGVPDLVVSHFMGEFSVFAGDGSFGFEPIGTLQTTASEARNAQVLLADLNNDGALDLIAGHTYTRSISVWRGNGDGSFRPEQVLETASDPKAVAIADFDANGKPDIASGHGILPGNGDGTFQSYIELPRTGSYDSVAAADWNGDGLIDLAVPNNTAGSVSLFAGNGDGTFRSPQVVSTGATPSGVVSADFDGDQLPDLAVANTNSRNVSIIRGRREGGWSADNTLSAFQGAALAAADFNHDGMIDLAAASVADDRVYFLGGRGDGFSNPVGYAADRGPWDVAIADFNQDSLPDVAVANSVSGDISVFWALWEGGFTSPRRAILADDAGTPDPPSTLAAADLNGDGLPDLVGGTARGAAFCLGERSGSASFPALRRRESSRRPSRFPISMAMGMPT